MSIALFGFNNYTFEEIIQLNWEGSEGYKNGVGIVDGVSIPISVTYELTPGEDFRLWFFVAPIADQYTINIDIMPCYEVDYEDIDGKTVTFDEATEIMDLSSIDANGTRFDIYNFKINNAELEALSVTIDQGVFALYVPNAYYSAEEVLIAYLSDNIPANAIRMGDMETLQTLSGSFDMAEGDFRFCLVVVTATIFPPYTVSIKCEKVPAYEIDYADIKSGVVEYTVPTEYMPTEEGGEVDLYNFRIKGITEDAKVYLYVQNISWGGYVVKDYNLDLETTMGILLGGSNIPGDAEIDSLATGGQFLNACDLTAGQTFKAMILHVTVPGAPLKVQVYCVPNGERPYLESDFAYKLTGDKTGYSIFLPNLASEKASVVIPDEYRGLPVTEIATYGFRRASSITSVTMGKNIKKIGDYAFDNLTKITSITLPEGLTHIGKGAFNDTLALESIHIPDSVVSIGDRAFAYSYIKTITFSENSQLTSLGKEVFWYVWHIESITIPSGIMSFDSTLYKQEISSLKTLILMPKEGYKWQWSTDGTNWYDFTDNKPSGPYYRQVTI